MSRPFSQCLYKKAYFNKQDFLLLVSLVQQPIYTVLPCKCNPPCELNGQQKASLEKRVNKLITRRKREWLRKHPINTKLKWTDHKFPIIKNKFPILMADKITGVQPECHSEKVHKAIRLIMEDDNENI